MGFTPPPDGPSSAAELTEFINERHDFAIGGACFPEVHPEADSPESDLAYLKTKVTAGARFLITQLFFDNSAYFDFVAAARARRDHGADHPRGRSRSRASARWRGSASSATPRCPRT